MRDDLAMVALNSERDKPRWKLTKSGVFSVKSLYNKLWVLTEALNNYGKLEFLLKLKYGYGLYGIMI
jgi:hypothetical protein